MTTENFEFVCAKKKNRYVDEEKTGKAEGRKEERDQEQKRRYAKNGDGEKKQIRKHEIQKKEKEKH